MSRKQKYKKKIIKRDKIYNSLLIEKFLNFIMKDGKKQLAEKLGYSSIENLSKEVGSSPEDSFNKVIKNVMPKMEVKSRRVGGSTYQVPVEVSQTRGQILAIRWLVKFSRDKKGRSFVESLTKEMVDAYNKTGQSIKKREDTHKMAEANKAFSHFRW